MDGLIILFVFLAGIAVGGSVTAVVYCLKVVGSLRIDDSEPDGPYLFLELKQESVGRLCREPFVILKVNRKSYISRE